MKKVREEFGKMYEKMATIGCAPHAGNLISKDIFNHESIKPTFKQCITLQNALKVCIYYFIWIL